MNTPISFTDLQTLEGLTRLDALFLDFLNHQNSELLTRLLEARSCPDSLRKLEESALLLSIAPFVEDFLAQFFGVEEEVAVFREEAEKASLQKPLKRQPYERGRLEGIEREGREGFACITPKPSSRRALIEARGCLLCHERGKDSCATGLRDKKEITQFRLNAQKLTLAGCPLEQKISEMHALRQKGHMIGALAMILVDNPLVALSGLRICTDCEAACVFQQHQPINTLAVETEILRSVLGMAWGVEMYALLARWNPLNLRTPLPKAPSGKRVLIAGLGPAGLTLAHYLTQEGHSVWGIDGLKVEPLNPNLLLKPIRDIHLFWQSLEDRLPQGVGGVAEYGITARWDKNFLTLVRILLERRPPCLLQGGMRLGSNITPQEAFASGIDHIALCLGAGRPDIPDFITTLPSGVRLASDFLMTLQGGAAYHPQSPVALQVRLPIVVIGGGLTAVDAATEALAFYDRQLARFASIEAEVRPTFDEEDADIVAEFRAHAAALHGLSNRQKVEKIRSWGGVTLLYRKSLIDAPSMRISPEEVKEALKQGVIFREGAVPVRLMTDGAGGVSGLELQNGEVVAARTVLLATGLFPNTVLCEAYPALKEDPRVSVWGDLDPAYHGSVVKAMASVKQGYQKLSSVLQDAPSVSIITRPQRGCDDGRGGTFFPHSSVHSLKILDSSTLELILHASHAAQNVGFGQFFKLQQMGCLSEGIAVEPTIKDLERGLLTFQIKVVGASTQQLLTLKVGDPVMLMGPLGKRLDTSPVAQGLSLVPTSMQCMMSQICAQCVQFLRDPHTGQSQLVYTCQEPYQPFTSIDQEYLVKRRAQNRVMERALWALQLICRHISGYGLMLCIQALNEYTQLS